MSEKEQNKSWEEELSEYGQLHNEDCCVNFSEDGGACDVGTDFTECCENMKMIASFIKNKLSAFAQEIISAIPEKSNSYEETGGNISDLIYSDMGFNSALSQTRQAQMEIIKKYNVKI